MADMKYELFVERCAELLNCEDRPAIICVAIQDLQDQIHNAKKMIAHLRGENARLREKHEKQE